MRKIICCLCILFVGINLKAQITGQVVVSTSDVGITKEAEYDVIVWNKSENFIHQNGAPQLPVLIESFVVPYKCKSYWSFYIEYSKKENRRQLFFISRSASGSGWRSK